MKIQFWPHGYRKRLAEAAKLSPAYLSDILVRRRGVGPEIAKRLVLASKKVFGFAIPAETWMHNKTSNHPIFQPKMQKYENTRKR